MIWASLSQCRISIIRWFPEQQDGTPRYFLRYRAFEQCANALMFGMDLTEPVPRSALPPL
jgi:hypothetical protein